MAIKSYRQALNEAIAQEMRRDPTVFVIGEDVCGGTGAAGEKEAWGGAMGVTKGLFTEFGANRVIDTPISESAFVGAAVGAATQGLRPIVELMFVDFLGVCLDQLMNQAGKFRYMFGGKAETPVVVRTCIGAGLRAAAQHSQCLYSMFTHLPGLKCVVPSSPYDAKGLLIQAIRDDDPVIFCEHKHLYYHLKAPALPTEAMPVGKARIARPGRDLTIVAYSAILHDALTAADEIAGEGAEIEVVDLRSIKPLDTDTIVASVARTGRLLCVGEAFPWGGVTAEVIARVATEGFGLLDAPPQRLNAKDTPIPYHPKLWLVHRPTARSICAAARRLLEM